MKPRTSSSTGIIKAGERDVGERLNNAHAGDFLNLFFVAVVAGGSLLLCDPGTCCQAVRPLG